MERITRSASCRTVAISIACLTGTADLTAQSNPVGVYRSETATVRLTPDGQAIFSGRSGLSLGSYRIAHDTIALRDDRGTTPCPGETGFYLWRVDADTLRLRLVSDPCDGRRALVSPVWTRMAGGAGPTGQSLAGVVITAQRQVEDVQRAPVAITVVPATTIRDAGVTRPQALTYLTPGLQVGSLEGGSALLYLRGVGNFAGTSLQDPTVNFNFDGVYMARPGSASGMFYDLERVEVLKGPQGTLYGRNATGGAINILPRRPELGVFGGDLSAEYGEYNTMRVDGALNVPLGDRAALRVAGQHARHDAYMKDGTDDQNDWAGRLSVRFDASNTLEFRLTADYYDQDEHGVGSTPLETGVNNRFGISSPEGGAYFQTQRHLIAGRNWYPMPFMQYSDNRQGGVNATADWRTGLGALTLVAASRWMDRDATSAQSGNLFTVQEHSRQTSVEARLASAPHPRLATLVGLFRFDDDNDTPDGGITRPWNQFNFLLSETRSGVTSTAPFGRVTWHATDRLRATLGVRYTSERKHFAGSFHSFNRICPPVPTASCPNAEPFPADIGTSPLVFPPDASSATPVANPADGTLTVGFRILSDDQATFSRTTWRAALEHDLAERAMLYASYENGFKSGGFFFSSDEQVYQPEYVGAFTLGLKSRLLDSRLQANVELFNWSYTGQQVSKISVDSRGIQNLRTENVGMATIRGAEVSLAYLPSASLYLSADVQYLDATYDSYTFETPNAPITGCDVTPLSPGFQVDCSGRRAPYAPEWTLALEASQTLPLGSGASVVARVRPRYQSETLAGLDFLDAQHQEGYWITDASLTVTPPGSRYTVSLFGHNLTDQTILSNTFVMPFGTFPVGALRPPRTLGVRLAARF